MQTAPQHPLPPIKALRLEAMGLNVVPFYFPGHSDLWHQRLSSGPLGNFWPSTVTVSLAGVSGTFATSEVGIPRGYSSAFLAAGMRSGSRTLASVGEGARRFQSRKQFESSEGRASDCS